MRTDSKHTSQCLELPVCSQRAKDEHTTLIPASPKAYRLPPLPISPPELEELIDAYITVEQRAATTDSYQC